MPGVDAPDSRLVGVPSASKDAVSQSSRPPDDIWAWLDRDRADSPPDLSCFSVTAALVSVRGEPWTGRCAAAIQAGEVRPTAVVDGLPDIAEVSTDWIWLVPDSCQPRPGALAALLNRVVADPGVGVVGALLIHPPRRGPGVLVSSWAQTLTGSGRLRSLVEPGELYQGQLVAADVLGVPAAGMLVRRDVWVAVNGIQPDLPPSLWGLDLGWRATLAGYRVIAEPEAQVVDVAEPDPAPEVRAAGLALAVAHTPRRVRWLRSIALVVGCLLATLGFLVGKDVRRAGAEVRGLARWLTDPELRQRTAAAVSAAGGSARGAERAERLRPDRWDGLRRGVDGVAGRVADWAQTFSQGVRSPGLDELTGDDFAGPGRVVRRLVSVPAIGVLLGVFSLVAARTLVGSGSVRGPLLLPAPEYWLDPVGDYLGAVPGPAGVSPAPWSALTGLASLVTFGRPDWLVTLVLVACVPIAWVAAYRLLRVLLHDAVIAGLGAAGYALAAALTGQVGQGSLTMALWTILLPIAGYSLWWWAVGASRHTWRGAAAIGLWLLLAVAWYPPVWLLAAVGGTVWLVRRRSRALLGQVALVLLAPLLLLAGPWAGTLGRFPGRLLTGSEPVLGEALPPPVWTLPLAWPGEAAGPPLWLSLVAFGVLWLAAVAGAARRRGLAVVALAVAGAAVVLAGWISRVVVWVPPGSWVRATWTPWLVVMSAGLVVAAAWGLDGVAEELRGRSLGLRHAGTLALLAAIGAATLTAGGWWAWAGLGGLQRSEVGRVPAFVRNSLVSPTPGRLLALDVSGPATTWAVAQDDFARLGDAESGLVVPGDPAAAGLAASVATRLVSGSADDRLASDLAILGVSHIWLGGGDGEMRAAIGNVPGLGVGTGDETHTVWTVPGSGRAVLTSPEAPLVVGDGFDLPTGAADRRLVLAEPADPRWRASVAGASLTGLALPDGRQAFEVGSGSGRLSLSLDSGSPWWAWLQLGGLALLLLVAAPGLRRESAAAPARRIAGGAE